MLHPRKRASFSLRSVDFSSSAMVVGEMRVASLDMVPVDRTRRSAEAGGVRGALAVCFSMDTSVRPSRRRNPTLSAPTSRPDEHGQRE